MALNICEKNCSKKLKFHWNLVPSKIPMQAAHSVGEHSSQADLTSHGQVGCFKWSVVTIGCIFR
jgi:hypothetical protein